MVSAGFRKRCIRACCLLWLGTLLLHTAPRGFGRTSQPPLSELRERTGLALRRSARGADGPLLSKEERQLLKDIDIASKKRDWPSAESLFATYAGSGTQIYSAAMHAAFRCREYKEGSTIFEKCRANCEIISQPISLSASASLQNWETLTGAANLDDALKAYPLDEILDQRGCSSC